MPDFTESISVAAPRQKVIDYVTKVENMPDYLPSVKEASMIDSDHVHMEVDIHGQHHEDSGFLHKEDGGLQWGSEDHDYHGEMNFDGDDSETTVSLSLHINPRPEMEKQMDENTAGDWESKMREGVKKALASIKEKVEAGV